MMSEIRARARAHDARILIHGSRAHVSHGLLSCILKWCRAMQRNTASRSFLIFCRDCLPPGSLRAVGSSTWRTVNVMSVPDVAPTSCWAAASDLAPAGTIGASPPPASRSLSIVLSCKTDRRGLASDALATPRSTSASRTMHRVNDRWSTRSGVRVSAPDIAVGGSDRRRRDRQREVRPCAAEDWPGRFRFRNHFGRPKICTGTRTRKVKPVALPSERRICQFDC